MELGYLPDLRDGEVRNDYRKDQDGNVFLCTQYEKDSVVTYDSGWQDMNVLAVDYIAELDAEIALLQGYKAEMEA